MLKTPVRNSDLEDKDAMKEDLKAIWVWKSRCATIAETCSAYPTGEQVNEAYWRTLIANTTRTGRKVGP